MSDQPLNGLTVVVTRPVDQAASFVAALEAAGAAVVAVPTLLVEPTPEGRDALRSALTLTDFAWVVVTSANGARCLRAALDHTGAGCPRVAAVGPRTADVLAELHIEVDLVPERFVAEALVDGFPEGRDAVLVVRPEQARHVIADGLRAKGHGVTEIAAYRTVAASVAADLAQRARSADAVTFTSPLAFGAYVDAVGLPAEQLVVTIGPVTSAAVTETGIREVIEADPHTTDAMVGALIARVARA